MRRLIAMVLCFGVAGAEEAEIDVPVVGAVISAEVAALPDPQAPALPEGLTMAVTSTDAAAQKHVLDGISNLHGGWDFEAYRHFCAALELDPECLMAHWGVAVSLANPEPSLIEKRNAALERMVALVQVEAGTELERSYAYAVAVLFQSGPAAAADAFRKISEKFPNDLQLKLMMAAFGRSGYDEAGNPRPDQEKVEAMLKDLLKADPDHPLLINAYLTVRGEAPDVSSDLPLARRLVELAPDYAPFRHVLGHFEMRSGNFAEATAAFEGASGLYREWMKASKVAEVDCPGLVKAECYRAAALAFQGKYDPALAAAKSLAALEVPEARVFSEGGRLLLWEGRTLAARLLMRRSKAGDIQLALGSLPAPAKNDPKKTASQAVWFYQGLAFALEAKKSLEAGDGETARRVTDALTLHGEQMNQSRKTALGMGEGSTWNRAYNALEITAAGLRGDMAMAGPKNQIAPAFNWYRAALDRQKVASMMMPPIILFPMEAKLADYYIAREDFGKAADVLLEGLPRFFREPEILARAEKLPKGDSAPEEVKKLRAEIDKRKAE